SPPEPTNSPVAAGTSASAAGPGIIGLADIYPAPYTRYRVYEEEPLARPLTNPLALAVLTLLSEESMHPYEISTTLKQRRKEDSIKLNFGSLYSVVESLEKRGLIEVRGAQREGNRPERTIYGVTEEGRQLMRSWLGEMLSTPAKEFPQFEAALSLMPALPP